MKRLPELSNGEDANAELQLGNRPVLSKFQAAAIAVGAFLSTTVASGALFMRVRRHDLAAASDQGTSADVPVGAGDVFHKNGRNAAELSAVHAAAVRTASLALLYGTLLCAASGYVGWRVLLWYAGTEDMEGFAQAMQKSESAPGRLRRRLEQGRLGRTLRRWYASMEMDVAEEASKEQHMSTASLQKTASSHWFASWLHTIASEARTSRIAEWLRRHSAQPSENGIHREPRPRD